MIAATAEQIMADRRAAYDALIDQQVDDHLLQRQAYRQAAAHVYQAISVLMESPANEDDALSALDAVLDRLGARNGGE